MNFKVLICNVDEFEGKDRDTDECDIYGACVGGQIKMPIFD